MTINSITSSNYYTQLSSGYRINSAADDPSGLAIAEKLEMQSNGYDVGSNNAADGRNLLNTAEGALGSISDMLGRMRELSVQAANTAVNGPGELESIQAEIDQLKGSIQGVAKQTQFNGMNLLDGSKTDWHIATNPDGNGSTISTANATLEALGIADYDVTGQFDIGQIDEAINMVSEARSSIGASTNALTFTSSYNDYASFNLVSARSRVEDLDIPKAVSERDKERILQQYQFFFMKKKMEEESNYFAKMFQF